MWALAKDESIRHDYGSQKPNPIAICGYKGKYPINYNAVRIPKCQRCLLLWPTYGKENKKCGDES